MESKLLELYEMSKGDRIAFLANLSDKELTNLSEVATSCTRTIDELTDAYWTLDKLKKKGDIPFIGIWWLIKKGAKKEWEDACRAAVDKINKKEKELRVSYIWNLLNIEKKVVLAEHPSCKNDEELLRSSAAIFLGLKMRNEVLPIIIAEFDSRE